ncbi:ABC transporter ATP-binding protein [Vagococcus elongatus]|uniref:Molybdenum ABC transporter ATP-binding protein n=1 Tax=Vagococcus elongatus TaxID=180344 RepID=A0A430B1V4_9ENTE|nr:ABC transporter ATP-binding protein [Vagococcus elongatus]RSU14300.1 molybdenum ABC transporter ATP-binding protein [Vagococcus elongatus]
MFEFKGVSFEREDALILKEIDWQMKKGEHWAILGLNGSGKTTLLKMLNGYLWPSKGELTVLGHRFGKTSIPELRKNIGWISSDLQEQLRAHDIAEDIVLSGKFASIGVWVPTTSGEKNKAKQTLIECGGEHLIGKKYGILSQGEQQLVLIARALMANPSLLVFDEPCNGLDLFARDALLKRIDTIGQKKSDIGLIFVTHYIEEIPEAFDNVLLLKEGEIFAKGKRDDMFQPELLSQFYDEKVNVVELAPNRITITLE